MTELDLILELRPEVPLAGPGHLDRASRALAAAIAAEQTKSAPTFFPAAATPAPAAFPALASFPAPAGAIPAPAGAIPATSGDVGRASRRLSRRAGRRALTGAVAAVAAAAAVAMLAVPASRLGGPGSSGGASGPGGTSGPVTGPSRPAAGLTAARFLDAAASAALHQPAAAPRPGQYVYAETQSGSSPYQSWRSANGARPGLVHNAQGWFPLSPCTVAQAETGHCGLAAGYLPGLPTRPDRLPGYLARTRLAYQGPVPAVRGRGWTDNYVGKDVSYLMMTTCLRPAQRAALLRYLARVPGFTVVPHAVDAIGRHGTGIAWRYQGTETMLIFAPGTYAYLGYRTVVLGAHRAGPYQGAALVRLAVVSQLPHYPAPRHQPCTVAGTRACRHRP